MDLSELFQRVGIALGLGLIVGLQRERSGSSIAGFRTFALITLFGALCGLLAREFGGFLLAGGLLALAAVIVVEHLDRHEDKPGATTEMSMLVMYAVGALVMTGQVDLAVATGGSVAVLLHLKPQLHSVAHRLEDPDFKAIMQFVLITLVILPILPNRAFGPYQVLNPYKIWLMVVLIVGISLTGYIIYKFFGQRAGTLAGGILGGLMSSTATSVSYARRSAAAPVSSPMSALVIMVASSVLFARILIILAASAPSFFYVAAGPVGSMLAATALVSLLYWRFSKHEAAALPPLGNPSEMRAALVFAALYALVLLSSAAAREKFGSQGLYFVAILSGLTDMDAITLSVSDLVLREQVSPGTGWRLILTASLANLVFKTGIILVLGSRPLLKRVLVLFGISGLIGMVILRFWF